MKLSKEALDKIINSPEITDDDIINFMNEKKRKYDLIEKVKKREKKLKRILNESERFNTKD